MEVWKPAWMIRGDAVVLVVPTHPSALELTARGAPAVKEHTPSEPTIAALPKPRMLALPAHLSGG